MNTVLFYYTLCILLISIFTAALSFSAHLVTKKKFLLYIALGFVAYFFDVSLVFLDDFNSRNLAVRPSVFETPFIPAAFTLFGLLIITCMWLAICEHINEQQRHVRILPPFAFAALSVISLNYFPQGRITEFIFFSVRALLLIFMAVYLAVHYIKIIDPIERQRLWRGRWVYLSMVALTFCLLLENVVFLLLLPAGSPQALALGFYPERNFAENILMIVLALQASVYSIMILRMFHRRPLQEPAVQDESSSQYIESSLTYYAARHKLSAREEEVLSLILAGKDNQNIASNLNVALSTVKVHIHHILNKTGMPNRQELIKDFWKR